MTRFTIDARLRNDCHVLGYLDDCHVLLMNNAELPWFILVPETEHTEFHHLETSHQQQLLAQMNQIANFIEQHFRVDKLNTACIGNIVNQLHVHIVGRRQSDPYWPGVVWGCEKTRSYAAKDISHVTELLLDTPGLGFRTDPAETDQ